jgi:transcriptional regulator with XRE-family HTH domain
MNKYPIIDVKKTGIKIKYLCTCNGISVKQIQDYIGLACIQTIYNWYSRKALPSIDNLIALGRLLNKSLDSILYVHEIDAKAPLGINIIIKIYWD